MHLINPNLFVVSGGPGAGKTTVLQELASRGYRYAPEIARQIIQEEVQSSGTALPWKDREAYTLLMLEQSVKSYLAHTPAPRPTFSDRGIPDTLCYARLIGLADQESILDACRQYRYAPVVFLAPPWKEIYETDNERKQDFAEAERTFEQMVQVYRECGYAIAVLPKAKTAARADFILKQIHPGRIALSFDLPARS
jgi:predicted ATPase